jgi:hypothetical protein
MSVDPDSGKITVSKSNPPGTYTIKIIGTLPDLTSTVQIFTITIGKNSLPTFQTPLSNITVPLNDPKTYTFPQIIDQNVGDITSISIVKVKDSATDLLPSFITYTSTSLEINPTKMN